LPARSMTISSSLIATWFKSVPKFWRISIAETTFDTASPFYTNLIIIIINVKPTRSRSFDFEPNGSSLRMTMQKVIPNQANPRQVPGFQD
jgi:hypothetical protein